MCDPVFFLFFTTGLISAPSWRLAVKSGIVALDGEMVASFLADHDVGVDGGEFQQARFEDWLEKYRT